MTRDDFSAVVRQIVANRVNSTCSNPDCGAATRGPQIADDKAIDIGVAAHITAAAIGGPRYDLTLSSDERKHAANAIWLCQSCAKLIDSDVARFTERLLLDWKRAAETTALLSLGKTAAAVDGASSDLSAEEIDILSAASTKGEIHIIETDELDPIIMVEGIAFADETDPAYGALYHDALESLQTRGLVKHSGGILYALTGRGFKLGRALEQSRDEYAGDDEDEEDSDVLYDDQATLIADGGFEAYPCEIEKGAGIRYEVDANNPIDIFLLDSENYETWRNEGSFDFQYEQEEQKSFLKRDFWPEESGEYVLVISNPSTKKRHVEVKVIALNEDG